MGLDMYLRASKTLDRSTTDEVLKILGLTVEEINPYPEEYPEEGCYLSAWMHADADELRRTIDAYAHVGLAEIMTTDSPSGQILGTPDGSIISVTCVYWRKANHIHKWFVDNCQGGVDECQLSDPIDYEQLAYLVSICKQAADAYLAGDIEKAGTLLPPQPGFFFGSTDLDEWWLSDTQETALDIELAVKRAIAIGGIQFNYQSSW